jgi:hypothetical protein
MKRPPNIAVCAALGFVACFTVASGIAWSASASDRGADLTPEAKCALDRLTRFSAGEKRVEKKLVFVYFTPADREPPPGYRERLARVMGHIQAFYAHEMERHGLGGRTIRFDRDANGGLIVHDVKGKQPTDYYLGRDSSKGGEIARDARPILAAAGIDDQKETIIYFCDLRTEKDGRTTGIGPYYGTGSSVGPFHYGHCWFTDATILDPDRLADKNTKIFDEEYRRISVGRYNSIFIGGAAHELGHGLGLPHDKQHKDDPATSLMGSGNRTYGEELRGEGRGSFLTLADALRLASHPMFSGTERDLNVAPQCRIEALRAEARQGQLEVSGQVIATPEPYALIVYNDPFGGSAVDSKGWHDYSSTTWTAALDDQNRFTVRIGEFKPGAAKLRMVVCHVNGSSSQFIYPLHVDVDGTPDAIPLAVPFSLRDALAAWAGGRSEEARQLAERSAGSADLSPGIRHWAATLAAIAGPEPQWPALADVPADAKQISLSRVNWDNAQVGWMKPARNHFPREVDPQQPFLCLAGEFHADGLYAHQPSRYEYDLAGRWKTFTAEAGFQSGAIGSAVFVVKADGRELFRSEKMEAGKAVQIKADVSSVKKLELLTEDAGDGNRGAWSIWCDPMLHTLE